MLCDKYKTHISFTLLSFKSGAKYVSVLCNTKMCQIVTQNNIKLVLMYI